MQWACAESWIGVLKIIISSFLNSCGTDEETMAKWAATWTHLLSPRTCLSNTQFPTKSGWENKVLGSEKPGLQDVPSFHKWMERSMVRGKWHPPKNVMSWKMEKIHWFLHKSDNSQWPAPHFPPWLQRSLRFKRLWFDQGLKAWQDQGS